MSFTEVRECKKSCAIRRTAWNDRFRCLIPNWYARLTQGLTVKSSEFETHLTLISSFEEGNISIIEDKWCPNEEDLSSNDWAIINIEDFVYLMNFHKVKTIS